MKCLKICIVLIVIVTCYCLTTTTKTNAQLKLESNFKMSNTKSEAAAGMSIMDFLSNAMNKNSLQSTKKIVRSKNMRRKSHNHNQIYNEISYGLSGNTTNSTNTTNPDSGIEPNTKRSSLEAV